MSIHANKQFSVRAEIWRGLRPGAQAAEEKQGLEERRMIIKCKMCGGRASPRFAGGC